MQSRTRQAAALLLMLASGFAGLGYQLVWTQQTGLWLGHESAAVLAVLAAFFGGISLGALALGPRIERSTQPRRYYIACELLIGLWSLALIAWMPLASAQLMLWIGPQPTPPWQGLLAFAGTFALLLPATTAMGATLPALERALASWAGAQRSIAGLYAANTLGAVLGVLASAFWLIPLLGLAGNAALCAALNGLCACLAWRLLAPRVPTVAAPQTRPERSQAPLWWLACSGLLGIAYEVMVLRVLSQVMENTVYTFALLLTVYLIGTALGAALWQGWQGWQGWQSRGRKITAQSLSIALALACLLGTASLWGAEDLKSWLLQGHDTAQSLGQALSAEALLALAAFALPTLLMGALFSQLSTQAHEAGHSFGRAIGINTLGAACAPLLFGLLLAPSLGAKNALLLIPLGYLALALKLGKASRKTWLSTGVTAAAMLGLAALAPPLAFISVPEGGRVLSFEEGSLAAVSVVEDAQGVSRLRINNRQQEGSSSSLGFDARQALLPLLLHPAPREALFLGLGTGLTAGAAASDPTLQVTAVELLPEVIRAARLFSPALGEDARRPQTLAADARRFVRASEQRFEVIVSDNFHPARSGSGALYTVEHFQAVRARLAPGGLFCQWLPLHQLDLNSLRSIVAAFIKAYPEGHALLANNSLSTPVLGLIARPGVALLNFDAASQRLASAAFATRPADFGIEDEMALLGSVVAGPAALQAFAAVAAINSDDRPIVSYRAPFISYAPDSTPAQRVIELLGELAASPLKVSGLSERQENRLQAYRAARLRFLSAGLNVRPSSDVRLMLAQLREPLLQVLHLSPDFRPAFDPLLRMALALAAQDAEAARTLLQELQSLHPQGPEAAQALSTL